MRGLSEIVFSVTNQCPARCTDCPIVHEGMPPASLDAEFMIQVIKELLPWKSLGLVVFTGGEPFLCRQELRQTIAFAASHDILTRIVTNAYWATSKTRAKEILRELKDAGLTEINISCDDFHQEFIPLENIKNANEAALEENVPALLALRQCPEGKITVPFLSSFLGIPLQEYRRGQENPDNNIFLPGKNIPIKTGYWERPCSEGKELSASWTDPCDSVLSKIVISPDKKVEICCGIASGSIKEFYIGSLEEEGLFQILQKGNEDLIANWLALAGPASILEFVLSKEPTLDIPDNYVNRCHLCNELFTREEVRQILREHAVEQVEIIALLRGILEWANEDLSKILQ